MTVSSSSRTRPNLTGNTRNPRNPRNTRNTLLTVAAATAAIIGGSLAIGATDVATAATKSTKSTPKLGAKCSNAERGRTTNTLVCSKVGSKISWVKRKNPVTGSNSGAGGTTTGDAAVSGGATAGLPRPLDVVTLVNGTAPTATAIKVDVTCTGLGGPTPQATQSVSFTGQGGSQSVSFNILDPGTANPTGSTCTATATVTGAAPTLRILIDGRPTAGPAATTLAAPAFAPRGQSAVTVLADFGTSAAPTAATNGVPGATTTLAGATTTTIAGTATAPPASGKPEVSTRFLGVVPTGLTNVDVNSTCTSPTAGGAFQTNSSRFARADATAILPQTLTAATATTQATSCQLTATLLGTDLGNPSLRVLLNGLPIAGPASGNLINSPAFAAPLAFGAIIEITYPGATTTTTIAGATTTTIAGATTVPATATTVTITRTGTPPASVAGYSVALDCNNVRLSGGLFPAAQVSSGFPTTGGNSQLLVGFEPNSTCAIKVATLVSAGSAAVSTGTVSVNLNGTALTPTTNGSFSSVALPFTKPSVIVVTVAY